MNDRSLKYYMNGKDQGIAFKDICFKMMKDTQCLSALDERMSIKLTNFQYHR